MDGENEVSKIFMIYQAISQELYFNTIGCVGKEQLSNLLAVQWNTARKIDQSHHTY